MSVDEGYRYLIEIMIPLNHDRYKNYFNYFLVVNSGLAVASIKEITPQVMQRYVPWICSIGVLLSIVWMLVLFKISVDILKTQKTLEKYEAAAYQTVKITQLEQPPRLARWLQRIPATYIMNLIPLLYVALFSVLMCQT